MQEPKLIVPNQYFDDRGYFYEGFNLTEFPGFLVHQVNTAFNKSVGTFRGFHYQTSFYKQAKIVRCIKGIIWDVIINLKDLTVKSFLLHDHYTLYIPENYAHGYLCLENNCEVQYLVNNYYNKEASRGIRWNDPKLKINWPLIPKIVSEQDLSWPDL